MDGILFYWLGWIFWIIATFLMSKGKTRTLLALSILFIISFSLVNVTILGIEVNISFCILVCGAFFVLAKQNYKIFSLFVIIFIGFCYTGLRLWEVISPIWFIVPRIYVYTAIVIVLTILFSKNYLQRCLICCLSISLGEILYIVSVNKIGWTLLIGDSNIMDMLSLQIGVLFFISIWKEIKFKFGVILQQLEQENKRWTNE